MSELRRASTNLSQAASALSAAAQAMAKAASSLSSTTQTLSRYANTPGPAPTDLSKHAKSLSPEPLHDPAQANNPAATRPADNPNRVASVTPNNTSVKQATRSSAFANTTPSALSIPTTRQNQITSLVQGYDSTTTETTSPSSPRPRSRHHVLLKNESEVLVAACCLARKFNLIACYLPITSLVSVPLYQELFSRVLDLPVGTVQSTTVQSKAQEDIDDFFNNHSRGMLLLPESIVPEIDINPLLSSCVIHVGWPSRQDNYDAQVAKHNMQHSVLLAFTEDEEIYPVGLTILSQSEEWPESTDLLAQDIPSLRPLFQIVLSGISSRTKERIYPEWISDHGIRGRRHVESWSATTLVYRANLYLLDVLGYQPEGSLNESEAILPHVSAGFITHNQLEAAVEDGVLNSGSAQASSGDYAPPDAISLNDSGSSVKGRPIPAPTPAPVPPPPRTYIVLDSDFDLYPFLFELVSSGSAKLKVVCFVKELVVVNYLIDQLKKAANVPVFVALSQAEVKLQQAAESFHSVDRGLLFWGAYTEPHPSLSAGKIDHVVHICWISDSELRNRQSELSKLSTVILARSEYSTLAEGRKALQSSGLVGSQRATQLNKRGDGSQLDAARKTWRTCLANTPVKTLRNCYTHWMMYHFAGKHKVSEWTAIDLVKAANHFARNMLLRGSDSTYSYERPVGGQLSVTLGLVNHLGLQAAQQAGLLIADS